jgi:hypothetical protein
VLGAVLERALGLDQPSAQRQRATCPECGNRRPRITSHIREHIAWLNRCLTDLDQELGQLVRSSPVWRERVDLLRSTQ